MKSIYVLYHSDCWDGLFSALCAKTYFSSINELYKTEFIPVNYGEPLPRIVMNNAKEVYILDFCYPYEELILLQQEMAKRDNLCHVTILDHHISAKDTIQKLDKNKVCAANFIFNNNMSGSGLSYLYFIEYAHIAQKADFSVGKNLSDTQILIKDRNKFLKTTKHTSFLQSTRNYNPIIDHTIHKKLFSLCRITQDIDLWKYKLWDAEAFSYFLMNCDLSLENFDLNNFDISYAIDAGEVLQEFVIKHVNFNVDNAVQIELQNSKGEYVKGLASVCHDPRLRSHLGEALAKKSKTFGAVVMPYLKADEIHYKVSLRSISGKNETNVENIAKCYGGGGHKNASGIRVDKNTLHIFPERVKVFGWTKPEGKEK